MDLTLNGIIQYGRYGDILHQNIGAPGPLGSQMVTGSQADVDEMLISSDMAAAHMPARYLKAPGFSSCDYQKLLAKLGWLIIVCLSNVYPTWISKKPFFPAFDEIVLPESWGESHITQALLNRFNILLLEK